MTPLVAVLAVLAVYRLALLVSADEITEPPRSWLIHRVYQATRDGVPDQPHRPDGAPVSWDEFARRDTNAPKAIVGLLCPWCVSAYIALPVAWTAYCFGTRSWWLVPALALSASAGTGFLAEYASPAK